MTYPSPEISIILLCYRAEHYVPTLAHKVETALQQLGKEYEVILVANFIEGSLDKTPRIAQAVAKNNYRLRVIAHPKRGMFGWDVQEGLREARAGIIAFLDGDSQVSPNDLISLYSKLEAGGYDMVQGRRIKRGDGVIRRIVSISYNLLFRMLFPKVRVKDVNAKPKMFRREKLQRMRLTSNDWFIDAEIVIQATYRRFSIGEVETEFTKSEANISSSVNACAVTEFIKNMLRYRMKMFRDKSLFQ
jgi:glycosyltransferase involved in cell wall biosynthesis